MSRSSQAYGNGVHSVQADGEIYHLTDKSYLLPAPFVAPFSHGLAGIIPLHDPDALSIERLLRLPTAFV